MNLSFGLGHAVPEAVKSAWGARLIFPDDLLPDRQDLVVADDAEKAALLGWLNPGPVAGIAKMKEAARKAKNEWKLQSSDRKDVILFKDDVGVIVGNPNASHGYLYVAAWLHNGEADKQPAESFQPIVYEARAYEAWKPPYVCGDGKRFDSRRRAINHAKRVFAKEGKVISVEYEWPGDKPLPIHVPLG
jgi:hypothetical protein